MPNMLDILCCPRCQERLAHDSSHNAQNLFCANARCVYAVAGFPVVSGLPILVDFERSIFARDEFVAQNGASLVSRDGGKASLKKMVKRFFAWPQQKRRTL